MGLLLSNRALLYSSALAESFIFTIDTTLGVGSTFLLPLPDGQNYDFTVIWGDGSNYSYSGTIPSSDSNLNHTYSSGGSYQISIQNKCGGFSCNNYSDAVKITSVDQWGDVGFDYLQGFLYGCVNNTSFGDIENFDFTGYNLTNLFNDNTSLIGSLNSSQFWDNVGITVYLNAFRNCQNITNYASIPFDWKGMVEVGTLTTDQTTLQQVGINRTCTGIAEIHWGDGSFTRTTSGAEATHDYGGTGTYDIKLGAESDTATTKLIADNSRLSSISGLKTGLLTDFRVHQNLLTGTLSMVDAPVSGIFHTYLNPNLTEITYATTGNGTLNNIQVYSCNLSSLNFANVPIEGVLFAYSNPNLSSVIFATSGNGTLTNTRLYSTSIVTLDFTNVPIGDLFYAYSIPTLNSITFASTGNALLTDIRIYSTGLSTINLANNPTGGTNWFYDNPNLTTITFASTGNSPITSYRSYDCPNLSSIDFTNTPINGSLWSSNCASLTNLTFGVTNTKCTFFDFSDCNLSTINLTNLPLDNGASGVNVQVDGNSGLGTFTLSSTGNNKLSNYNASSCNLPNQDFSVFTNSDGVTIQLQDNNMTSTEVDNQIINLGTTISPTWANGTLNIAGTNAARTAASDTAYNNLIANGWSITVN